MAKHKAASTKDLATALARYLKAEEEAYGDAIAALYGQLPAWLPEPVRPQILRALASLRECGQSDERISEIVSLARDARLEAVPGTVRDVSDFLKSAYDLAHIQRALSLDKADAIKELAGSRAAQDYQRSKRGNEVLHGTEAERQSRNRDICSQAAALRKRNQNLSANDIAKQLAPAAGLSARHVKRILLAGHQQKK